MPETASNSASLTPLHLDGRDNLFSKLRALREVLVLNPLFRRKLGSEWYYLGQGGGLGLELKPFP